MNTLALAAALTLAVPMALAQSLPWWAVPSTPAVSSGPSAAMAPPVLPGGGAAPAQVPLDGGLSLLALAGGAYAVRRLRSRA